MERRDTLLQTVAEFFGIDPGQIGPDFPLAGKPVQSSLAQAKFFAAIQHRLGVRDQAMFAAQTYGELQAAVCGTTPNIPAPLPSISTQDNEKAVAPMHHEVAGFGGGISCGIDIEAVHHLPEVQDYWDEAFYKRSFTSAEIAYCLMQENPRMHFAGRWCAKEALRKCDPIYLHEAMANLEVASNEAGAPFIRHYVNGVATVLPFAISISHTPQTAIAIVMRLTPPKKPPLDSTEKTAPVETNPTHTARTAFGLAPVIMVVVALASVIWALIRTLS